MCENRYNKRSFVWLVILTFAGQRRPIHDVVQTYLHFGLNCWPSCSSLINFVASILQFDQFDQFCCINPPGDLGYSRRRQAQLSNVPTQITNSHSMCVRVFASWIRENIRYLQWRQLTWHMQGVDRPITSPCQEMSAYNGLLVLYTTFISGNGSSIFLKNKTSPNCGLLLGIPQLLRDW